MSITAYSGPNTLAILLPSSNQSFFEVFPYMFLMLYVLSCTIHHDFFFLINKFLNWIAHLNHVMRLVLLVAIQKPRDIGLDILVQTVGVWVWQGLAVRYWPSTSTPDPCRVFTGQLWSTLVLTSFICHCLCRPCVMVSPMAEGLSTVSYWYTPSNHRQLLLTGCYRPCTSSSPGLVHADKGSLGTFWQY